MKIQTYILLLVWLVFSNCKKEVVVNDNKSASAFGLVSDLNQDCYYVYASYSFFKKETFLMVLSTTEVTKGNTSKDLVLTRFTTNGSVEWTKTISKNVGMVQINATDENGSVVIITNSLPSRIIKIDPSGEVVFNKIFDDSLNNGFCKPIQGDDFHYYTMPIKLAPWAADTSAVLKFDGEGKLINQFSINDLDFDGNIYVVNIFRKTNPSTYYFHGLMYTYPINWWDNPRHFVTKLEYDGSVIKSKKTVVLDPNNGTEINNFGYLRSATTPENDLLIVLDRNNNKKIYKTHLMKIDVNLKLLWEIDIQPSETDAIPNSIRVCEDGNYLVCGYCVPKGKGIRQPYAVKVDKAGNILWTKIFTLPHSGYFSSGFQNKDGNCYFGGTTYSFGQGNNQQDLILLKTNSQGEIK